MTSFFKQGRKLLAEGKLEEAVMLYRQAINKMPNFAWYHHGLGNALSEKGSLDEAITAYRKAVELNSSSAWFQYNLGQALDKYGNLDEAIACYRYAIKLNPNYLSRQNQLCKVLLRQGYNKEVYQTLWNSLNNPHIIFGDADYNKSEINLTNKHKEISDYFLEQTKLKSLTLGALTQDDKTFLEHYEISIENLELIRKPGIQQEVAYTNSFYKKNLKFSNIAIDDIPQKTIVSYHYRKEEVAFQQSIVETGYMYSLCPVTGKVLRTNQSFYINQPLPMTFYRFVGSLVFYIIAGDMPGDKKYLYFPSLELLIKLETNYNHGLALRMQQEIARFKTALVSRWHRIKNYISNTNPKQVVACVSSYPNLGHYTYNEMTAIHYLYRNKLLDKIDKFLVGPHEAFDFPSIFPEVPKDKIQPIEFEENLFDVIVDNNYFVTRFTDFFIKNDLINRIYQVCINRSSKTVLQKLESIRNSCFPLLWINIRTHNRVWLSQVEGIANIINTLHSDYPNLGVIFSGWPAAEKPYPKMKSMIEKENNVVSNITKLIEKNTKFYNTIGCSVYESVVVARAVDVFMGNNGSETIVYMMWLSSKPGIVYGNKQFSVHDERLFSFRENPEAQVIQLESHHVKDIDTEGRQKNWDCDWKVVYNKLVQVIEKNR